MSVGVGPTSFHRASSITNLLYTHTPFTTSTHRKKKKEKNTHTHTQENCLFSCVAYGLCSGKYMLTLMMMMKARPSGGHSRQQDTQHARKDLGGFRAGLSWPFTSYSLISPWLSTYFSSFLLLLFWRVFYFIFWKMAGYFVRCLTPNFSFLLYSLPSCPVYPFCISITLKNSRKRNLWFINKPRLPTPHQQRLKRREMKEGRKK